MVQTANSPANVRCHGASRLVQPKGRCRLSARIVGEAMHLSPLHLTNQAVRIPYPALTARTSVTRSLLTTAEHLEVPRGTGGDVVVPFPSALFFN